MTFEQYLAAFVLGRILSTELPAVATQALLEGYESTALGALAGSTAEDSSPRELTDLWNNGLQDLHRQLPSRREAAETLKRYYCSQVASGELTPRAGARALVELSWDLYDECPDREFAGDGLGIATLYGLYFSHDDVRLGDDATHGQIDREILEECRRLGASVRDAV